MINSIYKYITGVVKLRGSDGLYDVDVVLEDGVKKLVTTTTVKVESLNGFDDLADNWIYVNDAPVGSTLRILISATAGAPALDKTFTVLAGEDRYSFSQRVIVELNNDFVNFYPYYKAVRVKDNSILHISSKFFGEYGENTAAGSFSVIVTGGLSAYVAFDDFIRRGKVVGLSRSEDDPRYGILGISGEVASRSGDIGGLFVTQPKNLGSVSLLVDGTTPKVFTFPMFATDDIYIREIRFFGKGNGIKFGQFLSKAGGGLSNGIRVEIKTDNKYVELPRLKLTEDFKDKFAFGSGDNFQLYIQSGGDSFSAVFISESPFPLRKAGAFGVGADDYIKITIEDNIVSGITSLESLCFGYTREA